MGGERGARGSRWKACEILSGKPEGKDIFEDILLGVEVLICRHRASCILGEAFHCSPENAFYIFNQQIYFIIDICLTCVIDINNIDHQLDATITAY